MKSSLRGGRVGRTDLSRGVQRQLQTGKVHRFEVEGRVYASRDRPDAVVRHPDWKDDPETLSLADIARTFLATPPAVEPLLLNQSAAMITWGLPLTLVGYGKAGTDIPGLGVKRRAENEVDEVEATRFIGPPQARVRLPCPVRRSRHPAYRFFDGATEGNKTLTFEIELAPLG